MLARGARADARLPARNHGHLAARASARQQLVAVVREPARTPERIKQPERAAVPSVAAATMTRCDASTVDSPDPQPAGRPNPGPSARHLREPLPTQQRGRRNNPLRLIQVRNCLPDCSDASLHVQITAALPLHGPSQQRPRYIRRCGPAFGHLRSLAGLLAVRPSP